MHWEKMTIDEYAEYERGNGANLVRAGNIWWKAVRPFFYRPLFPFHNMTSGLIELPALSVIGGYQYPVADEGTANSHMNYIIFDDIHSYSIDRLRHKQRNEIKRAMKNLEVQKIDDRDTFIQDAYNVYREFYNRTLYQWRSDRLRYVSFVQWADHLFAHKKVVVHGLLSKNSAIVGINLSYLVEDVIMDAAFFSTTQALKMGGAELAWHTIREWAAETRGARYIYEGTVTGSKGLDESKIRRGCRVVAQPAHVWMNQALRVFYKYVGKSAYYRLLGMDSDQVRRAFYSKQGSMTRT